MSQTIPDRGLVNLITWSYLDSLYITKAEREAQEGAKKIDWFGLMMNKKLCLIYSAPKKVQPFYHEREIKMKCILLFRLRLLLTIIPFLQTLQNLMIHK